jgi:transposase
MESSIKKTYTSEFKSKVAIELIREAETMTQICSKYQIHPTQAGQWKQRLLKGAPELFGDRASAHCIAELEKEKTEMLTTVGKLAYEVEWLKKRM